MNQIAAEIINRNEGQGEKSKAPSSAGLGSNFSAHQPGEQRPEKSQNENAPDPQIGQAVEIQTKPLRGEGQEKPNSVGIGPIQQQVAGDADDRQDIGRF